MNESIDNITLNEPSKYVLGTVNEDSDNESITNRYKNLELRNENSSSRLPPSKKLKSIIHSFFDENDNDDEKSITIATENITNKTVYIDETSSSESEND